jgi:serine/threonine protein kinase/tetratricopeptide (TPR) repeat protein
MPLSAADLMRMSRLLDEALPLDAAGRQAWLDALAPEHRDLAPALKKALLTEDGQVPKLESLADLPSLGPGMGAFSLDDSAGLVVGTIVGPYRLIRELGRGGMGSVWLGERSDGSLKRQVALKLPHSSLAKNQLVERFNRERDILANLVHAHIARLYDAGVTAEGQPWLALEYVEGQALTTWCDARKLGIPERLALFQQVLAAVHYAHRMQVIHRDLKPANILVTGDGEVRLLDFGIAKLMVEGEAHETALTQIGGRALSPQYASPEQILGKPLGSSSDVYSLGVVLHELLTGALPYQLTRSSKAALEEAILSVEPTRASDTDISPTIAAARGGSPKEIAAALKGDVDTILQTALTKNPADRYDSAKALADDIDRFLRGQKVEAKPATMSSRVGKFVRRNRGATVMTTIAMVMTLVGAIAWPSRQPTHIEQIPTEVTPTATLSEKSVAVLPFVDMSEKKDQEYFSDGLSEELIGLLAKVPGLHVPARTSSFYFKGKPDDISTIAGKLHVANVLEGSVRKSGKQLRITVQLVRADNGYHLWSETYDRKLDDIFKIQDDIAGQVVKALKVSLLAETMPMTKGTQNQEAYDLYLQARSLRRNSTKEGASTAIDYLHRATQLEPRFAAAWAELSRTRAWQSMGGFSPTNSIIAEARDAAHQAMALDPDLAEAHLAIGAISLNFDWNWAEAEREYRRAMELEPHNAYILRLASEVPQSLGRLDETRRLLERSIALDPLDERSYRAIGDLEFYAGRLTEAEAAYRKALDIFPTKPFIHRDLGMVLLAEGNTSLALTFIQLESDGASREQGLAMLYSAIGRKTDSDAALAELENNYATVSAFAIAEIYAYRGQIDQAFDWLERAYRQRDAGLLSLKGDPLLKNIERDPRYKALLRKMKLPE